jgi:hypothetical protein
VRETRKARAWLTSRTDWSSSTLCFQRVAEANMTAFRRGMVMFLGPVLRNPAKTAEAVETSQQAVPLIPRR